MIVPRVEGPITVLAETVLAAATVQCNANPALVTAQLYNFAAPVQNAAGDYTLDYVVPPNQSTGIVVTTGCVANGNAIVQEIVCNQKAHGGGVRVTLKSEAGAATDDAVFSVLVYRIPTTVGGQ